MTRAGTDVALTGLPRSGTTLACHVLNKLPDVVALNEPMQVQKLAALADRGRMCDEVATFFAESRRTLRESGSAFSRHVGGAVPDNVVGGNRAAGGGRKDDAVRGVIHIEKPLPEGYLLCIKHPVAFSGLLPELARRLPTFAVVRNPLSVLASWNSVQMPFTDGHAPAAESLDAELRSALASIGDVMERQLHLMDWFFRRYRSTLAAGHVLRYEDIIGSGGAVLAAVAPSAAALKEPLVEKNTNKSYEPETVKRLAERLLASDGAWWDFYQRADVERVRRAILD
jgi:hypothetical protein